jgi:hypothetical protein
MEFQINIKLEREDFLKINEFVISLSRPKLSSDFADFITQKIQSHGVKCWMKNDFNWVSKKESMWFSSEFSNKT